LDNDEAHEEVSFADHRMYHRFGFLPEFSALCADERSTGS
jgi:hypothetical protein